MRNAPSAAHACEAPELLLEVPAGVEQVPAEDLAAGHVLVALDPVAGDDLPPAFPDALADAGEQRGGVGTRLLRHVEGLADKPVLIGTWADAKWALDFYRKNGYAVLRGADKDALLARYWSVPARQMETSVVLADRRWMEARPR